MIDRHNLRDDDAAACPVPLFVQRVFREILRDVLRQVGRELVPQAPLLERVPDVDLAVPNAYDALPDRAQHAVILAPPDGHMEVPRAPLLALRCGDILEGRQLRETPAQRVEITLQAGFVLHVLAVRQRDHSIRSNRLTP